MQRYLEKRKTNLVSKACLRVATVAMEIREADFHGFTTLSLFLNSFMRLWAFFLSPILGGFVRRNLA